jgi:energy-coupling factor transporter ATP-binding protein EcfA2
VRFLSLHVRGFGGLRPGEYRFGDRTLVVEPNATGKSTLAAALRAALYGLEGDRRRQHGFTDLEAWEPWCGGAYGLTLLLQTRDGFFTIERDFARAGGQLTVRDTTGADITARFLAGRGRDRAGELLTGVGEPDFLRAALAADRAWGQPWRDGEAGRLTDLLGQVVSSDEGGGPAAAALAACDEALRQYEGVTVKGAAKVETEIQRIELRLGQIRTDREATERRHDAALAILDQLAERRGQLARLDVALDLNRRRRLGAQAAAQRRALETRSRAESELAQARRRAAALAPLDGFPPGREVELAAWAERCAQGDREADIRRRRMEETLRPELARLEAELADAGFAGAGVLGELESGVAALLEREARLAELRVERDARRARIAEEGEDPELQAAVHAGLACLGETERRFLREQERLGFERDEIATRLDRDESAVRVAMAEWASSARGQTRGRNAAGALAVVGGAGALGALLLRQAGAPPPWTVLGVALGVALLGAGLAVRLHRHSAALRRRCELQGTERLTGLDREREALRERETARRDRLAEIAPVLLPARFGASAPTADDLTVLYRRHESFRVRHDDWFRLAERGAEEEAEIARLHVRLAPFLDEGAAALPAAGRTARLQTELARRRRIVALEEKIARVRESLAQAGREEAEQAQRAQEAGRRAAAILAVLPPGCRYAPPAPDDAGTVRDEIARLVPLFRADPAGASAWFAARAAEAAEALHLGDELLPALERRLAELPAAAESARALAATEGELALQAAAAATAAAAGTAGMAGEGDEDSPRFAPAETPAVDELLAQGEALQERRRALAGEIGERARGVAEIERERRAHLPDLARQERELVASLQRARDFRDAVTLAREMIAKHAGDVYGRWAAVLDADAARLATRLCPEIAGVAFTPELDYVVTLADGRRLDAARADRQLSRGVRDQLVLAVRLALARFLARPGEPLPLLLDDPFAHYDDARFRRGMSALAEEASGHQIILLTCQAERQRWLREVAPESCGPWTRLEIG